MMIKSKRFPKRLLGPAKSVHTLAEMLAHPICLWGMQVGDGDGVIGGDETGMRSWLGKADVTRDMWLPQILLRVKGTDLWASGQYDRDGKLLDALGVFGADGPRPPFWYIQTPGIPITYVAVPTIEGRKNVEFVARNRRRSQALRTDAFTRAQAERAYEAEIDSNENKLKLPAMQMHRHPKLLKVAVVFLQRVARDILPNTVGVVFSEVSGWLEDEDPALFKRLLEEATTDRVRFRPFSCWTKAEGLIIDSETKEQGILVTITSWKEDGKDYVVTGSWRSRPEHAETVEHRVSKVKGLWVVKD